jgi:Tfp pilus assembly protein PilX
MKLAHSRQASARTLSTSCRNGAALVLVLIFVVLLTALAVAMFSRAISDRQISYSSASQSKAELLARGALAITVGDLKQELAAGSTLATISGVTIYSPKPSPSPSTLTPALVGSTGTGGLENLVKRSANALKFYPTGSNYDTATYPPANRAAGPSSQTATTVASQNSRSVSRARWNKPLLLQKATLTSDTDITPVPAFVAPDWILIARDGSNPTSWNTNMITSANNASSVMGRYAYTIYDEGGLIDMNVAGYPTVSTAAQVGRKGTIAYADLRQLTGISSLSVGSQTKFMNNIVGWRNYSSANATGGNLGTFASGSAYTFANGTSYYNAVLTNTNGFLLISNNILNGNQSDRMFSGRQQLIKLLVQGMPSTTSDRANLQTALEYLGTFSRELNRPTWKPSTPTGSTIDYAGQAENSSAINRDLATVRVQTGFIRSDGTSAAVGEPLFKNRFPLRRLSWLTYKGPSALRNFPPASPALSVTDPDYDMWQLLYAYGVPQTYLLQGTAANIKAAFGLVWDTRAYVASPRAGQQWVYVSPSFANSGGNFNGTVGSRSLYTKTIATVQNEAREPDFFEILKAVILNGSVGLGSNNTANTFVAFDPKYYDTTDGKSADYQIMQIGANIMDAWDTDNIPTFIAFGSDPTNSNLPYVLAGIENIPYLNKLVFCPNFPPPNTTGYFDAWLVPSLWNPHQNASNATGAVRIVLSGSGSYIAVGVDKIDSTTITTISPPMAPLPASMDLPANGFDTPTPPSDPNPVPSAVSGAVTNVGPPEKYYGFHYPFTSTTPNATLVEQRDADSAWPDFGAGGMNVELQVQIPGTSSFIPYQTWKIAATSVPLKVQGAQGNFNQGNSDVNLNSNKLQDPEFVALDPRTSRFGIWGTDASGQGGGGNAKKDYYAGASDSLDQQNPASRIEKITLYLPQGASFTVSALPADLSLYSTNGTPSNHYVDLDGVQRPGDWTTTAPGTTRGTTIMYASSRTTPPGGNIQDRPQILSAPFQSVAELGQVFRDQPWKTLNFTIANSSDAGLLDAFSLQDVPMTAGRTSLNTRQAPVLSAILSQAMRGIAGTNVISAADVTTVSNRLVSLTAASPMISKSELVTTLLADPSLTTIWNTSLITTNPWNKEARECLVRAFSDACQTRTWNLMIDVIAQSGRYPPTATGLSQFVVEGEKRYWLHIAIDRFTGEVLDQQLEAVYE